MLKAIRFFAVMWGYAVILSFSSCASTKHGETAGQFSPVYITDTKKISVLPPQYMDGELESLQFFSGSFKSHTFSSQVYIQADQEGVSMLLLNDLGVSMGTLSYSAEKLSFSSPYFPQNINAEYILADFQNTYYDTVALQKNYAAAGLAFYCKDEGNREWRRIQDGEYIIEEIEKDGQNVTITNRLRSYTYELKEIKE